MKRKLIRVAASPISLDLLLKGQLNYLNGFFDVLNKGSECRKRIDAMLNALDEKELKIVEATIQAMIAAKETEDA